MSTYFQFVDTLWGHVRGRDMNWRKEELMLESLARARRLDELEKKYDSHFSIVFEALRQLMTPPAAERWRVGFLRE